MSRNRIRRLGAAALAAVVGCATVQSNIVPLEIRVEAARVKEKIKDETVTAGNLYFYRATDYISHDEMEYVALAVQNNFDRVGIAFKSVSVIEGQQFPPLSGLDILMYVIDDKTETLFGISDSLPDNNKGLYTRLQSELHFPYTDVTSKAHTGILGPRFVLGMDVHENFTEGIREYCRQRHPQVTLEQELRYFTQTATHEIAHGLGAAHILGGNYMMSFRSRNCDNDLFFYQGNVDRMKQFIGQVCENNYDDQHLTDVRMGYLRNIFKFLHN